MHANALDLKAGVGGEAVDNAYRANDVNLSFTVARYQALINLGEWAVTCSIRAEEAQVRIKLLEEALAEYAVRYGLTERARALFRAPLVDAPGSASRTEASEEAARS